MPTRDYLSPGIYTQENDLSFLQSAPAGGPSAVFIGGFTKGQAFIPMKIKDTYDLLDKTGEPNGKFFSQYAAYQYSKHKGNFWVQRLLWQEGYSKSAYAIVGITGSETADVLALLTLTGTNGTMSLVKAGVVSSSGLDFSTDLQFYVQNEASVRTDYTLNTTQVLAIEDIFGTNPYQPSKSVYVVDKYTDLTSFSGSSGKVYDTVSIMEITDLLNYTGMPFNHAETPWIGNSSGTELFKLHHIGDGNYTNREIKIAVQRLNDSPTLQYAKFDIVIRAYDDTDKKPVILETFSEVDLNPLSESYIGKRIGDQYYKYDLDNNKLTLEGDYPNKSNYVRVELSDDVKESNIAKLGLPTRVYRIPCAYSGSNVEFDYPTLVTTTGSYSITNPYYKHLGYHTNKNAIKVLSVPQGVSSSVKLWSGDTLYDDFTYDYFVPMYGGFDGKDPSTGYVTDLTHIMGFDIADGVNSKGYDTYVKALNMLKNVQEFDIDVISIPGVNIETSGKKVIFEYALQQICEKRGDCIVLADASEMGTLNVAQVAEYTANFDSSFGAVYYPAVKIKCNYTKTFPIIPAATLIPSVIAYTERVSQPHYAPAGINRGTLNVLQAVSKLNKAERDLLYAAKINPIASFASNGTVVWGQKTLQQKASALDRLNVRILINRIAKWINAYGKTVLFDNNTASLRATFTIGVQAYLNNLIISNGLYAFKFKMDQTNNTPDIIDRNQLIGQVWIKPTKTAQFIIIPINIVRTDVEL